MATVLTVIEPFDGYEKGAVIKDAAVARQILTSEHASRVVKSEIPDPAPSGTAAKKKAQP